MSINSLINSILRGKKLMFLSVGFMVVFVWGGGMNPAKAQEKRDTVKQEKPIVGFPYVEPEFPGGIQKCYEFLRDNIQYPMEARKANWEGTVYIRFVVKKDGAVDSVTVRRSSGYEILDNEAVRIIKTLPRWIPAKLNGKPVSSYYQIPVKFQLNNNDEGENKNNNTEKEPLKGKKNKK